MLIAVGIVVAAVAVSGLVAYQVIVPRSSVSPVAEPCGENQRGETVFVCMTTTEKFFPSAIVIIIGVNNTVQWTNDGEVYHTSTSYPAGQAESWNSGILKPGGFYSFTFTESGNYSYYCSLHPFMIGSVLVES